MLCKFDSCLGVVTYILIPGLFPIVDGTEYSFGAGDLPGICIGVRAPMEYAGGLCSFMGGQFCGEYVLGPGTLLFTRKRNI